MDHSIEELGKKRRDTLRLLEETPSCSHSDPSPDANHGTNPTVTAEVAPEVANQPFVIPLETISTIISQSRNEDRSLPEFSGGVLEWDAFLTKFRSTTTTFKISDDANQRRLDKAIKGNPREKVESLLPKSYLVDEVIMVLDRIYGDKDNIAHAAMAAAEEIKTLRDDLKNFNAFALEASRIERMVKLCEMEDIGRTIRVKLIQRLPLRERKAWAKYHREEASNKCGNLPEFVQWLVECNKDCMDNDINDTGKEKRDATTRFDNKRGRDFEGERGALQRYREYRPVESRKPRTFDRQPYAARSNGNGHVSRYQDNRRVNKREPTPRIMYNRPYKPEPSAPKGERDVDETKCVIGCDTKHPFQDCPKFKQVQSQEERFEMIEKYRRCPRCCGPHKLGGCSPKKQ